MSTTEPTPMTREQIRARMNEIAPYPDPAAEVTAESVTRYLAVCAQTGWARNITPFIRDDQEFPAFEIAALFAAAHALTALAEADPHRAGEVAGDIADAWNDGAGIGMWLHEHLTALGVDPAEVSRLDEARLAAENSAQETAR